MTHEELGDHSGVPKSNTENLGIKIGSKKEAWWHEIELKLEQSILNNEESLVADKIVLDLAKKIIKEEKENFK